MAAETRERSHRHSDQGGGRNGDKQVLTGRDAEHSHWYYIKRVSRKRGCVLQAHLSFLRAEVIRRAAELSLEVLVLKKTALPEFD